MLAPAVPPLSGTLYDGQHLSPASYSEITPLVGTQEFCDESFP